MHCHGPSAAYLLLALMLLPATGAARLTVPFAAGSGMAAMFASGCRVATALIARGGRDGRAAPAAMTIGIRN
jgi:hypothetical protein